MQRITHRKIQVNNGFWQERQALNADVSAKAVYNRFSDTHRFAVINPVWKNPTVKSHIFYDSDTAKWIESVAYILDGNREKYAELEQLADQIIEQFAQLQNAQGYVNSYYQRHFLRRRFHIRNNHELYCAGHLAEAAVAYFQATGKRKLLKVVEKYMDYIYKRFMVQKNTGFSTPGHEEIELALYKLYRYTGKQKYKEMAEFFLEKRGRCDKPIDRWSNMGEVQSHAPIREQTEAVGHSVRALYLYSAMSDMAKENKDVVLLSTCKKLFDDIMTKMYITGGVGSDYHGESFTVPYDLPNLAAYCESCASIALMFFASRMQLLENDVRYADTVETVLYNTLLSSTSLDGKKFFYENPLEIRLAEFHKNTSMKYKVRLPITQRLEVFGCSCCPPNITRAVASIGDYIYTEDEKYLYLHQYIGNNYQDGKEAITIETKYPMDGVIHVTAHNLSKNMKIRIPSWCQKYAVTIDGQERKISPENGYFTVEEKDFDLVLTLQMEPNFIGCNPLCVQNKNARALCYGPVVYCVEGVDNGNLDNLYIDTASTFTKEKGLTCLPNLKTEGVRLSMQGTYGKKVEREKVPLLFIPYYAFANRGESDMKVWLPVECNI